MRPLLLLLCLGALSGCIIFDKKSETTTFLQFKSPATEAQKQVPAILVVRPNLPSALRRPNIIMLTSEGEAIIDDAHRWTAPLERLIAEAVANHLTKITGQATTLQTPEKGFLSLVIDVDHFELIPPKKAVLILHYHFEQPDGTTLGGGQGTWTEPMPELSAREFVDAQSKNLTKASATIAKTFQNLPAPTK
jgi:uncharacterized lipoprotein YmbA